MSTVLTVLLLVGTGIPAARASEGIGLSNDGVVWSDVLAQPLFDSDTRWVPGDVRMARFYVRNETPASAQVEVDVVATGVDELLATQDLHVEARVAGGSWMPIHRNGQTALAADHLAANAVWPIDIRVRFVSASTNESQLLPFDLGIQVRLVEPVTPTLSPTPPGPPPPTTEPLPTAAPGGVLAFTGVELPFGLVMAGAVAVAVGALLRRRASRGGRGGR